MTSKSITALVEDYSTTMPINKGLNGTISDELMKAINGARARIIEETLLQNAGFDLGKRTGLGLSELGAAYDELAEDKRIGKIIAEDLYKRDVRALKHLAKRLTPERGAQR